MGASSMRVRFYSKRSLSLRCHLLTTVAGIALGTSAAYAANLPTGGQIVSGTGAIAQSGNTMTIHQNSNKLVTNWNNFSIGQGNTVNFVQPSSSSVALNYVLGSNVSVIQGALNANGQIFLINPNGVLFTPTSQVNVGGLVASTQNISKQDFLAGNYRFSGNSTGSITNEGDINAATGGTVALIAATIVNQGSIEAQQGNVLLGAGNTVTLDLGGPMKLVVNEGALNTLLDQGGAIRADGGIVLLTAKAAGDLATSVINHTGVTEAQTISTGKKGEILLLGDMDKGTVNVDGTLDASAPNGGNGGQIETSAATVKTGGNLHVTAGAAKGKGGQWLIDPYNYIIDPTAAFNIAGTLNTGTDVTIDTAANVIGNGSTGNSSDPGNIEVQSNITKSGGGDATLTLKASQNITVDDGVHISSTHNKLNTVLWANDGGTGGEIWLHGNSTGVTIDTNGGYFTAGGGTNLTTGYAKGTTPSDGTATGNGITFDQVTLNTEGGNIIMRGEGTDTASGTNFFVDPIYLTSAGPVQGSAMGIRLHGDNVIDSGTGTITMVGRGVAGNDGSAAGIGFNADIGGHSKIVSAATSGTAISLTGDASSSTSVAGQGILIAGSPFNGAVIAATGGGNINITGTGNHSSSDSTGVELFAGSYILASTGAINITGTQTGPGYDITLGSNMGFASDADLASLGYSFNSPVTSSTSDITFNADTMLSGTNGLGFIQSTGTLSFLPRSSGNKILLADTFQPHSSTLFIFDHNDVLFQNSVNGGGLIQEGFSNIVFGDSNTAGVTLGAYNSNNNTIVNSTGNVVLGNVTIGNNKSLTINKTFGGTVTDTGTVNVANLELNASLATVTLDSATNTIGTVAADVSALTLVNNSALTIGSVGSTNGITASNGNVDVSTTTGDITISQRVTSTATGDDAIVINAGKGTAAATSTGGNIIISGSPTISTGSGGRATFFSGTYSDSSLATLVGTDHSRYNSDESATNYTASLSSGNYAIYREQPTVNITASNDSKTTDDPAYSGGNGISYGTFVNGDTSTSLGGTATYGGNSQGAHTVGTYNITPSGITSTYGYLVNFINGTLHITQGSIPAPSPTTTGQTQTLTAVQHDTANHGSGGGTTLPVTTQTLPTQLSVTTVDLPQYQMDPSGLLYWKQIVTSGVMPADVALLAAGSTAQANCGVSSATTCGATVVKSLATSFATTNITLPTTISTNTAGQVSQWLSDGTYTPDTLLEMATAISPTYGAAMQKYLDAIGHPADTTYVLNDPKSTTTTTVAATTNPTPASTQTPSTSTGSGKVTPVVTKLHLNADIATIPTTSSSFTNFKASFVDDVASALGISSSHMNVKVTRVNSDEDGTTPAPTPASTQTPSTITGSSATGGHKNELLLPPESTAGMKVAPVMDLGKTSAGAAAAKALRSDLVDSSGAGADTSAGGNLSQPAGGTLGTSKPTNNTTVVPTNGTALTTIGTQPVAVTPSSNSKTSVTSVLTTSTGEQVSGVEVTTVPLLNSTIATRPDPIPAVASSSYTSSLSLSGLPSLGLHALGSVLSGNGVAPVAATGSTAAALSSGTSTLGAGAGAGAGTSGTGSSTSGAGAEAPVVTPEQPSSQVVVPGAMVSLPPRPAMPDTGTPGVETPFPSLGDAARWIAD